MSSLQNSKVKHEDLLKELKVELDFLRGGGMNSFRIKTAEMALKIACTITDPALFERSDPSRCDGQSRSLPTSR